MALLGAMSLKLAMQRAARSGPPGTGTELRILRKGGSCLHPLPGLGCSQAYPVGQGQSLIALSPQIRRIVGQDANVLKRWQLNMALKLLKWFRPDVGCKDFGYIY